MLFFLSPPTFIFSFLTFLTVSAKAFPAFPPSDQMTRHNLARVITQCSVPNTAALTFDDGPWKYIYEVTRQLDAAGASATFFFNGNNYGCIYSEKNVKRIRHVFDKGHQVASHTWSHHDLSTLSWNGIYEEMQRTDQAIQRITGAMPRFVRPPYGNHNKLVRQVAAARNQSLVLWDFDSGDSTGVSASRQKALYDQLVRGKPKSVLSLGHEVYHSSVYDVLPHALSKLKRGGYRLVTVAECLGEKPYQHRKAPSKRNDSWKC
ncbi:carbohydrate esterase family 4 protein [Coprinopsis sp. MPI-PUGE-AT-0042]|nr:carbohydrate esterase family 4 protein [Coprinopsis sp. MPI-PUGE-AT-0042]